VSYFLGIDGGGTKTACVVGDESTLLAEVTSGPSNIVRVGEAKTRESLHQAVRQACAAAGISLDQIALTCVGVAGAARPESAAIIRCILEELLKSPIEVVGDMETSLEAAFGDGPGVIVIAGTGSITFGRDRQGKTARAGGWGFAVGDEGSAHWIGRQAIGILLRESDRDERIGSSPLAKGLFRAWGVNSLLDLAHVGNSVPPPDFAALLPAIVGSNDELARQVLRSAGRELAQLAEVVIAKLFGNDKSAPVPVAMIGGVFRHSELVRQVFYNELRRLDPRVELKPQVVEPVVGALNMARKAAAQS
jgi:N-acetylglucosamine kinase-like BadF-type ATPase